jgi:hypothetical protein
MVVINKNWSLYTQTQEIELLKCVCANNITIYRFWWWWWWWWLRYFLYWVDKSQFIVRFQM